MLMSFVIWLWNLYFIFKENLRMQRFYLKCFDAPQLLSRLEHTNNQIRVSILMLIQMKVTPFVIVVSDWLYSVYLIQFLCNCTLDCGMVSLTDRKSNCDCITHKIYTQCYLIISYDFISSQSLVFFMTRRIFEINQTSVNNLKKSQSEFSVICAINQIMIL